MDTVDQEQFNEWYNKFMSKFTGVKAPKAWFERVEKSHEKLRNKLGGVRLVKKIEMKDITMPVEFKKIEPHVRDIFAQIPAYFYDNKIDLNHLCNNTISSGEHAGTKWGKHIQHWMKKDGTDQLTQDMIAKKLSIIGEEWTKAKTKELVLYVDVTTDPRAFTMIGHYGPDNMSCFRQNGCNQMHKYYIGQSPNTYVVLVGTDPELESCDNDNVVARFWGVASDDLDVFSLNNYYPRKSFPEGNIFDAVSKTLAEILGIQPNELARIENKLTIKNIFQNKTHNYSCMSKHKKDFVQQHHEMSMRGFTMAECRHCRLQVDIDDTVVLPDGNRVCTTCFEKLPVCPIDGTKYLGAGYQVYDKDNNPIKIGPTAFGRGDFVRCELSAHYVHTDQIIRVNGTGFASKFEAIRRGYKNCKVCDIWSKDVENEMCGVCKAASKRRKSRTASNIVWVKMYDNSYAAELACYDKE